MPSNRHTLLVFFEAQPGKEQALKEALTLLVEPTLQEKGCINYDLHQSKNNLAQFMIYESWVNKEAHTEHVESPHIQAWRTKRDNLLIKPNEASLWEKLF